MRRNRGSARCGLLVLGLSVGLAACAGPTLVPHPESGIELRWPNGQDSFDEARAEAQARCTAAAKRATLTYLTMDRDETLVRFTCEARS